ncbi:MAG: hypothetical protein ACK5TO_11960 [Planctomycetaceae bacterium]|jgi:hypothetical protein
MSQSESNAPAQPAPHLLQNKVFEIDPRRHKLWDFINLSEAERRKSTMWEARDLLHQWLLQNPHCRLVKVEDHYRNGVLEGVNATYCELQANLDGTAAPVWPWGNWEFAVSDTVARLFPREYIEAVIAESFRVTTTIPKKSRMLLVAGRRGVTVLLKLGSRQGIVTDCSTLIGQLQHEVAHPLGKWYQLRERTLPFYTLVVTQRGKRNTNEWNSCGSFE